MKVGEYRELAIGWSVLIFAIFVYILGVWIVDGLNRDAQQIEEDCKRPDRPPSYYEQPDDAD